MTKVKINMDGMKHFKKSLEDKCKTRVGILGAKATQAHNKTELTNADVGALHEFGAANIPRRSFLQYPLETFMGKWIKSNKDTYFATLKEGTVKKFYVAMGFEAERIIDEAFSTSGYGTWPPNAPVTIKIKGSSMPLLDTGQLKNSITSVVLNEDD